MKNEADHPYTIQYDLGNCDMEPIHFISVIQSHACLLVCREKNWKIVQYSENCLAMLGLSSEPAEKKLQDVIPPEAWEALKTGLSMGKMYLEVNPIRMKFIINRKVVWYNCLVHWQEDLILLEIEQLDHMAFMPDFLFQSGMAVQRIQQHLSISAVLQTAAGEIRKLTGYDRVMIYQFGKEGHGEIVAEAKEPHLEPLLGIRYPATDIPPQARAMYMKNPVRIISDVESTPSPIIPALAPDSKKPLDLTDCVCRGVSPIHLEYLKNMGVRATMSIGIILEGRLWGLIACHHYQPKSVGFLRRSNVWFLAKVISGMLGLNAINDYRQSVLESKTIKSVLFERMAVKFNVIEGLTASKQTILDLVNATGAAVYYENQLVTLGVTPSKEEIMRLIEWLGQEHTSFLYHTEKLLEEYPPSKKFKKKASGLLSVQLSNAQPEYILWFKQEVMHTVVWGGNPAKAVVNGEMGKRLSPRKSFEKWQQRVEGTSESWKPYELDTVLELRNDIKDFILQKYQEFKEANKELSKAYSHLETFSYTVSHDLRAPLRTIEGFSRILKEDYAAHLDEGGLDIIDTIVDSAQRMDRFINDLLAYTRAGKSNLIINELELKDIVLEEVGMIMKDAEMSGTKPEIVIHDLPVVRADRPGLGVILRNLLSNAYKYSRNQPNPRIEIGGEVINNNTSFYVRDNGIGFDMIHAERIFGVFDRLVNDESYEGTGIGLAIVRKIVEKHGGAIEVDSEPDKGATFFVRLPR